MKKRRLTQKTESTTALSQFEEYLEKFTPELRPYMRRIHLGEAIPNATKMVRYEERVFAFFDILGWSQLIRDSLSKPTALRRLAGVQLWMNLDHQLHKDKESYDGKYMTHFSDSIALSWPRNEWPKNIEETKGSLNRIIFDLAETVWNLFLNRFLTRGGLVAGKIFHRPEIVFGPALVDAYNLESKIAIYPRIVIHERLFSEIDSPLVRRDFDGMPFLDFLALGRTADWFPKFLKQVRRFILKEYETHRGNPTVQTKYGWLITYFNSQLTYFNSGSVTPITLD